MKRYLLAFIIILFAFAVWGMVHTISVVAPSPSNNTSSVDVPAAPLTKQSQ